MGRGLGGEGEVDWMAEETSNCRFAVFVSIDRSRACIACHLWMQCEREFWNSGRERERESSVC
jgi:hypothetical protein